MKEYKRIRAYHSGFILWLLDMLILAPYYFYMRHKTCQSLKLDYAGGDRKGIEQDIKKGAIFLTNHRDIVMDSAFLSCLLRLRYNIRPFIGIGNNLFRKWWIEPFVRFNHAFVVIRDDNPRNAVDNAKELSGYMTHLRRKHHSIWLAQREGRAKDSNDLTQPSVLKMLTINHEDFLAGIRELNICPISLSYEYDPCDYLKAKEMLVKRDNPNARKGPKDDVISMHVGINGWKGRVVFRMTPSINHWLDEHEAELKDLPRNEQAQIVAAQIDKQIHSNYEIFERGEEFDQYLQGQLAKIKHKEEDSQFLMDKMREMYSFPEINYRKAKNTLVS